MQQLTNLRLMFVLYSVIVISTMVRKQMLLQCVKKSRYEQINKITLFFERKSSPLILFLKQMFEDKFAKLPDEPAISNFDIDSSSITARNNGLLPARKRKRHSSKHNSSAGGGHTSSMITSSDDGLSSEESSNEIEVSRENTLKQLHSLQEQVDDAFFHSN